jgi:cobalt-zinc-cadmium efflux system outer membrane protein
VEVEAATIELQNARNRHTAAQRRLAAVVGAPDLDLNHLQGDLEAELQRISWDEALGRLLSESPEVARTHAGVERARWALQRECAGRVPNIDTQVSVRYDTSTDHTMTDHTIADVSIGMPLPVFDRNQGNICRARAELMEAEQEIQRLELQLRSRLAAAFQRYENARQQVERYSQNVLPTAKESLDLIVAGYRQGSSLT